MLVFSGTSKTTLNQCRHVHVSVTDVLEAMFKSSVTMLHCVTSAIYPMNSCMFTVCSTPGTSPLEYPFWAAAVIGPFVYISAVAHAALWRLISSIVGSVVSFYSMW